MKETKLLLLLTHCNPQFFKTNKDIDATAVHVYYKFVLRHILKMDPQWLCTRLQILLVFSADNVTQSPLRAGLSTRTAPVSRLTIREENH